MPKLPANEIASPQKVRTLREAARFIDAAGFCMLFPVQRVPLPSLYYAVTRRDPPRWDKETEMLWGWKDELPRKKLAFYAKYFRTRGTLISLKMLPFFLAERDAPRASNDFTRFYAEGRITNDAKTIWQALAEQGSMPTLELRHACKLETKPGNKRYKKAMLELQCLLAVVHFGTEKETGAWASGKFELTCRAFPKQVAASRKISSAEARRALAQHYRRLFPAATSAEIARLFGWPKQDTLMAMSEAA